MREVPAFRSRVFLEGGKRIIEFEQVSTEEGVRVEMRELWSRPPVKSACLLAQLTLEELQELIAQAVKMLPNKTDGDAQRD